MPRLSLMADTVKLSNTPTLTAVKHPSGYSATHEVKLRANINRGPETPEQQIALQRLDIAINSDTPPRDDVPRGYYLNIIV